MKKAIIYTSTNIKVVESNINIKRLIKINIYSSEGRTLSNDKEYKNAGAASRIAA